LPNINWLLATLNPLVHALEKQIDVLLKVMPWSSVMPSLVLDWRALPVVPSFIMTYSTSLTKRPMCAGFIDAMYGIASVAGPLLAAHSQI
jgi:hypothetical protein